MSFEDSERGKPLPDLLYRAESGRKPSETLGLLRFADGGLAMMKLPISFLLLLSASFGYGHARLMSPTPRNNNAGIKTGPCGGIARSATPMVVTGGQTLTVLWEETINHPGKFIFSLSLANDQGFQNNVLATVLDRASSAI